MANFKQAFLKKLKNSQGFTLIEMSIVLIIMGILASTAVGIVAVQSTNNKYTTTQERMEVIEDALALYVLANQRLPHPACPALLKTDANFGVEESGTCSSGGTIATNGNLRQGTIPTKTLDLPDSIAFDGWRNRFSYVVDDRLASSVAAAPNNFTDFNHTSIGQTTSITINTSATTEFAVYAIISHGINGFGSWAKNGSVNAASADADELSNSQANLDSTFVQKFATDTFDDLVSYRTKLQLLQESGLEFIDCPAVSATVILARTSYEQCAIDTGVASNHYFCNRYGIWGSPIAGQYCP